MGIEEQNATIATFDKYARQYQEKYSVFEPYLQSYWKFALRLQPEDSVLDIACGPANISQALLQRHPGLKIHGVDLSPSMLAIARELIPQGSFEQKDIAAISAIKQRFDAVVCGFALPYLSSTQARVLISDVHGLMHSGGHLYISAQLGDYEDSAYQENKSGDKVFVYYHSESFLTDLLEEQKFELLAIDYNLLESPSSKAQKEIFIQAKRK